MLTDKSNLLEKINFAIHKKWRLKSKESINLSAALGSNQEYADLIDKNYSTICQNTESILKLEQRIDGLEKQNDQLLCFIHFLVENLPDPATNILSDHQEAKLAIEHHVEHSELNKEHYKLKYAQGKNEPLPTRREKDILELLVKGFCAKEIANRLSICETTVITHKKNLKEKFSARNTVELISKALAHLSNTNNNR